MKSWCLNDSRLGDSLNALTDGPSFTDSLDCCCCCPTADASQLNDKFTYKTQKHTDNPVLHSTRYDPKKIFKRKIQSSPCKQPLSVSLSSPLLLNCVCVCWFWCADMTPLKSLPSGLSTPVGDHTLTTDDLVVAAS